MSDVPFPIGEPAFGALIAVIFVPIRHLLLPMPLSWIDNPVPLPFLEEDGMIPHVVPEGDPFPEVFRAGGTMELGRSPRGRSGGQL